LKNFDSTTAGVDCGGWMEAFLRRSKTLPLDVVVECRPFDIARADDSPSSVNSYRAPVLDKVYAKCLPHVARWSSVTLRVNRARAPTMSEAVQDGFEGLGGTELSRAEAESRSQSAPVLEKVAFDFEPFGLTDDDFSTKYTATLQSIDFILGWNAPMLEAFEVQGCPRSFRFRHFAYALDAKIKFGFKTITGVWAGVYLGALNGLLFLGRSLTTLTTLQLSFDQCTFRTVTRRPAAMEFNSVLEFDLTIVTTVRRDSLTMKDQKFGAQLERVLRVMRFPKAHTFSLTLSLKDSPQGLDLSKTARGIVHDLNNYPAVENFNLKVTSDSARLDTSADLGGLRARMSLDLPLSLMTSLKDLNVYSAIALNLFETEYQCDNYPAIRSISLDVPDYGRGLDWVDVVTLRLKFGQRWTDFEKLTVTLRGENQEKVETVVPRDEVEGWLKENKRP